MRARACFFTWVFILTSTAFGNQEGCDALLDSLVQNIQQPGYVLPTDGSSPQAQAFLRQGFTEMEDPPLFSDAEAAIVLQKLVARFGESSQIDLFSSSPFMSGVKLADVIGTEAGSKIERAAARLVHEGAKLFPPGTRPVLYIPFLRWNTVSGKDNAGSFVHQDETLLTILKRLHHPEGQSGTIVYPAQGDPITLDPRRVSFFSGTIPHKAGPRPTDSPDLYLQIRLLHFEDWKLFLDAGQWTMEFSKRPIPELEARLFDALGILTNDPTSGWAGKEEMVRMRGLLSILLSKEDYDVRLSRNADGKSLLEVAVERKDEYARQVIEAHLRKKQNR